MFKMKNIVLAVSIWVTLLQFTITDAETYNSLPTASKECRDLLERADYKNQTLYSLTYDKPCVPKGWEDFFNSPKIVQIVHNISERLRVDSQEKGLGINPKIGWVFRAFHMFEPGKLRVIILGQDPAPEPGLATGLAFSLDENVPSYEVPSVQRVILEARNEGYCVNVTKGILIKWADQGVLLLNTALTLIQNDIGSHLQDWAGFTDEVVSYISENCSPSVWILWGSKAKAFIPKIDQTKHYIVTGGHPSPKANPFYFFCQNYFYCASEWLSGQARGTIDWNLVSLPCEKYASHLFDRRYGGLGFYTIEKCSMQPCP